MVAKGLEPEMPANNGGLVSALADSGVVDSPAVFSLSNMLKSPKLAP